MTPLVARRRRPAWVARMLAARVAARVAARRLRRLRAWLRARRRLQRLEGFVVDRLELQPVAGPQQTRRVAAGVEQRQRRAADEVPAAGRLEGVDGRLVTGDRHRPRGDPRPRRLAPRHRQPRIESADIRKPGRETEHVDAMRRPRVGCDHPVRRQAGGVGNDLQIGSETSAVANRDPDQPVIACRLGGGLGEQRGDPRLQPFVRRLPGRPGGVRRPRSCRGRRPALRAAAIGDSLRPVVDRDRAERRDHVDHSSDRRRQQPLGCRAHGPIDDRIDALLERDDQRAVAQRHYPPSIRSGPGGRPFVVVHCHAASRSAPRKPPDWRCHNRA